MCPEQGCRSRWRREASHITGTSQTLNTFLRLSSAQLQASLGHLASVGRFGSGSVAKTDKTDMDRGMGRWRAFRVLLAALTCLQQTLNPPLH